MYRQWESIVCTSYMYMNNTDLELADFYTITTFSV